VLINFKICDNAKECNGPSVCPTEAIYWDEKARTLKTDNSKCISCGACEKSCPVNAIRVAKTEEEYKRIKKEIDKDPRKISDLFVDRYGAAPVAETTSHDSFDTEILESNKPTVLEVFSDNSIKCLLYSIPIKELFKGLDLKYRKMKAEDKTLLGKYGVKELPALLFFRDGKLLGKIEGYYDKDRKNEIMEKTKKITLKIYT